jgi:glycosyltransferase involved in cell wall biosynthesis
MWNLDRTQMVEVPYPFVPPPELLTIPVESTTATVGFVGRLELRKGVIDLAKAIPEILQRFPNTSFLFVGASERSPIDGVSMQEYIAGALAAFKGRISFLGRVGQTRMSEVFRSIDICVLPSLWENFPNACLEAMAAGRGVVGSSAGGMAQQLDDGRVGLLVSPHQPKEIAESVCRLLGNKELRMDLGRKARARVLSEYNAGRIGLMMETSYERAIRRKREGGRNWRFR